MLPTGEPGGVWHPTNCEQWCGYSDDLHDGQRIRRGCTRFDLPPIEWDVDPETLFYHGRHPDRRLHLRTLGTWERPTEDIEDGCAGGYQRSRILSGLNQYKRARTDDGGRVSNPFFDRCGDWLILSAILYLEAEEQRCELERERVWAEARKDGAS